MTSSTLHILSGFILLASPVMFLACGEDEPNIFHVDIVSTLDGGRDIEMVELPGGAFVMGSSLHPPFFEVGLSMIPNPERPVHFASVSSFMISTTEITQLQFENIMGTNPSLFKGEFDMPVDRVSWYQAADFCNKLSETMGWEPCYDNEYVCDYGANGFRLPTEAEWEFAARGGSEQEFSFGDSEALLGQYAWYAENSELTTHRVAEKEPNVFGLYDMHGNLWEWCQDDFDLYHCSSEIDPTGPVIGIWKTRRGGCWGNVPDECRSAFRSVAMPEARLSTVGFRVVRRRY